MLPLLNKKIRHTKTAKAGCTIKQNPRFEIKSTENKQIRFPDRQFMFSQSKFQTSDMKNKVQPELEPQTLGAQANPFTTGTKKKFWENTGVS